ncbi:MAG: hypothetical protein ABSE70_03935 [Candidatus Limnocylindrales bacterium]
MRKLASVLITSILLMAACSSSSGTQQPAGTGGGAPTTAASQASDGDVTTPPPLPSNAGDCTFWCGTGSAQVTVGGATVTMSPGGCYPASDNDVDARFGDFTNQKSDWIIALVYYGGSKTPILSGSVGGKAFMLSTSGATGTIGNDGKGSVSGSEFLGTAAISVTFSCK